MDYEMGTIRELLTITYHSDDDSYLLSMTELFITNCTVELTRFRDLLRTLDAGHNARTNASLWRPLLPTTPDALRLITLQEQRAIQRKSDPTERSTLVMDPDNAYVRQLLHLVDTMVTVLNGLIGAGGSAIFEIYEPYVEPGDPAALDWPSPVVYRTFSLRRDQYEMLIMTLNALANYVHNQVWPEEHNNEHNDQASPDEAIGLDPAMFGNHRVYIPEVGEDATIQPKVYVVHTLIEELIQYYHYGKSE